MKYREDCEQPLKQEQAKIQQQIATLTKQITTKQKQCEKFVQNKKKNQEKKCRTQLTSLKQKRAAQQGILSGIATSLSQLVTKPVTPKPPTVFYCCADSSASNYNSHCGITPNTSPNPSLCNYPTNPGCTDSDAINYDASYDVDDGSCQYGP